MVYNRRFHLNHYAGTQIALTLYHRVSQANNIIC